MATSPPLDEPMTTWRWWVLVELLLGNLDGHGEILVGQLGVDDLVAVLGEEGRFDGM